MSHDVRRFASWAVRLQVSATWLMLGAIGCSAPLGLEAGNMQQGLLASSCEADSDCGADTYCDVTQLICIPTRAIGEPLPVDALHDGSCTLQSAALLCRSAACNVAKKTCAGANGTPCNSAAMCANDVCGQNNLCGIEEGGVCDPGSASQCQTNRCRALPGDSAGRCIREGGCAIDDDCNQTGCTTGLARTRSRRALAAPPCVMPAATLAPRSTGRAATTRANASAMRAEATAAAGWQWAKQVVRLRPK